MGCESSKEELRQQQEAQRAARKGTGPPRGGGKGAPTELVTAASVPDLFIAKTRFHDDYKVEDKKVRII
jgi:hypothetical protein